MKRQQALERRLRQRIGTVIRRRTLRQSPPIILSRRRVYILPTRSGILFALVLLVMLLGASGYANSLAFVLTFWLAGIALLSLQRAHRNLVGLQVTRIRTRPIFVGESACFDITLANHGGRRRRALRATIRGRGQHALVDVSAAGSASVRIQRAAVKRGIMPCPALQIESRYPLGLFRAWARVAPDVGILVYPRPAGHEQLPEDGASNAGEQRQVCRGTGDFLDHRRYRGGDSLRHIDWKASARSNELLVREHAVQRQPSLWFDYHNLTGDAEGRLSQLALWVEHAAMAGHIYGLRLPSQTIAPARGGAHRRACLKALALF